LDPCRAELVIQPMGLKRVMFRLVFLVQMLRLNLDVGRVSPKPASTDTLTHRPYADSEAVQPGSHGREPVKLGDATTNTRPKAGAGEFSHVMYSHEKSQEVTKNMDSEEPGTIGRQDYGTIGRQDYGTMGRQDYGTMGLLDCDTRKREARRTSPGTPPDRSTDTLVHWYTDTLIH